MLKSCLGVGPLFLVAMGVVLLAGCERQVESISMATMNLNRLDISSRADFSSVPDSAGDIFSVIWDLPESHVSVTGLGKDGQPLDARAQVVVNEQGKAGNCLDDDHAPHPLLSRVDEAVFKEPTFLTLIALFDNFTAAELKPEVDYDDSKNDHWREVDAFLDAVFETKPMRVAIDHIQKELAPETTVEQIRADVKKMWFEPFTNHYRSDQPYCVGFEHVFVGEDESRPGVAPKCEDRVGGYHSWVKYYHEQKSGKVDYLGYNYPDGNVVDALADPHIATLVMRWSPTISEDGSHGNDLLKKPGGFFVGTRPELEIAFGALAMYAQRAGRFDNVKGKVNHHRVRLGENLFDLVMHPQTLPASVEGAPSERGDHIRTLYPKFRGREVPRMRSRRSTTSLPTEPDNQAEIQIVRALVNPKGNDDVGEWVELKNMTDRESFDLSQWRLTDRSGREKKLSGRLEAGDTVRVTLDRVDQNSMMLSNGEGWILLYQGQDRRAAVKYSKPESDVVTEFLK